MKPFGMCLLLGGVVLLGETAFSGGGVTHTKETPEAIRQAVAAGKAVLVDVREKKEWDAGHLKQARLVPLSDLKNKKGSLAALLKDLPKDTPVYCHCASGRRVLVAAEIMRKMGYDAHAVKEGYKDLLKKGFKKAK